MQKSYTWLFLFLFPLVSFSQSKQKYFYSATVGGGITGSVLSEESNRLPAGLQQTVRFNAGLHAWFNYSLGTKWDLQAGIGYMDMGFRRQQKNIQLGDSTYPGIGTGQLIEYSNTKKDIDYDYRFHYIQVPVLFNYRFYKSKDFRTNYLFSAGVSINTLVKHQITARLDNFTVDGEKKFQLDSTGLKAAPVNATINLGFRAEHKLDKTTTIIIQPMFSIFPFSATTSDIKVRPYSIMLHAGIVINLDNMKKE
jgi:hypothetical protein